MQAMEKDTGCIFVIGGTFSRPKRSIRKKIKYYLEKWCVFGIRKFKAQFKKLWM